MERSSDHLSTEICICSVTLNGYAVTLDPFGIGSLWHGGFGIL
jgi:hypothetical protein